MAIITSDFDPEATPFPYAGMPDIVGQRTGIPRGEVAFNVDGGSVTLAGVGDTQRANVTCTLPGGYAYVLRETFLSMTAIDVEDWDDVGFGSFQDAEQSTVRKNRMLFQLVSAGAVNITTAKRRCWDYTILPKQVLYPASATEGAVYIATIINAVTNGAAGNLVFNARFLQFDIEQANHYSVNSPMPTR